MPSWYPCIEKDTQAVKEPEWKSSLVFAVIDPKDVRKPLKDRDENDNVEDMIDEKVPCEELHFK